VLAFLAIVIGTGIGVTNFSGGVWPAVIVLPAVGLPIGIVLMIVLIVVSGLRRGREARDAGN
ncbi:MAG: hypothetical protein Q8M65_07875, partial [Rhodoglobus sp.]|nr:hypothetical protein [Rhodoglobus sp.]